MLKRVNATCPARLAHILRDRHRGKPRSESAIGIVKTRLRLKIRRNLGPVSAIGNVPDCLNEMRRVLRCGMPLERLASRAHKPLVVGLGRLVVDRGSLTRLKLGKVPNCCLHRNILICLKRSIDPLEFFLLVPNEEHASTKLRDSVISCTCYLKVHTIAALFECAGDFSFKAHVLQAKNVFDHKSIRPDMLDHAQEMLKESVTLIVTIPLSNGAIPLARRATNDPTGLLGQDLVEVCCCQVGDVTTLDEVARNVRFVRVNCV